MTSGRKGTVEIASSREFKKELDHLYAKRSTIDELIRSLQAYERFRQKAPAHDKRKTA